MASKQIFNKKKLDKLTSIRIFNQLKLTGLLEEETFKIFEENWIKQNHGLCKQEPKQCFYILIDKHITIARLSLHVLQ